MRCSLKILCAQWEGILHAEKIATPSMVPVIRLQSAGCILFKHPGGLWDEHSLYKVNNLLLQIIYRFPCLSVLNWATVASVCLACEVCGFPSHSSYGVFIAFSTFRTRTQFLSGWWLMMQPWPCLCRAQHLMRNSAINKIIWIANVGLSQRFLGLYYILFQNGFIIKPDPRPC